MNLNGYTLTVSLLKNGKGHEFSAPIKNGVKLVLAAHALINALQRAVERDGG